MDGAFAWLFRSASCPPALARPNPHRFPPFLFFFPAAKFAELVKKLERRPLSGSSRGPLKLFQRKGGEYHTVHGLDAMYVADEYFKTRDVVKTLGDGKVSSVNINHKKLARVVRQVILQEHRAVEVYTKSEGDWTLDKRASPGNLTGFEELLFPDGAVAGAAAPASTLAVYFARRSQGYFTLGVALVDPSKRTIQVVEAAEDDKLRNLEAVVLQYGVRECYLDLDASIRKGPLRAKVIDTLQRCRVQYTEARSSAFRTENIRQDLGRLVGNVTPHLELLDRSIAMGCLACLIEELGLLKQDSSSRRYQISELRLSQFVRLDASAVKALNLFPGPLDSDKNMSLYGLLDQCRTPMGSRLLHQWLMQPLREVKAINTRLDLVDAIVEASDVRASLVEAGLRGVPDLDRLIKALSQGKGKLQHLYQLWVFAAKLPLIRDQLASYDGQHSALVTETFGAPVAELVDGFDQFVALVEKLLDFEVIERDRQYRINPEFDPALGELKDTASELKEEMEMLRQRCADDLGIPDKKVKLSQGQNKKWHFRITLKDEKKLRNKPGRYSIIETRKDGVKFANSALRKCSESLYSSERDYERQQQKIVEKGMEVATTYVPVMERASKVLAYLDVIVSFAYVSAHAPEPYCKPDVRAPEHGVIDMKKCRHPCIETQDFVDFIPNDVALARGKSHCQIITGPNMGGKSTYIRQVGVAVLMAQIGCFVPCESATISVVDCILARVGAGDSQLKGVSTFMKEMMEAGTILRTATSNSLIIVDELGRGTSTYDGFGLAWAIAEHLATNTQAYTLFATHFHELTRLADKLDSVKNRHVTAHTDNKSITMLYQVNPGPCDRSFGIHVAELAKFPPSVVAMAKRKAEELEDFGADAEDILGDGGDAKTQGFQAKRRRVQNSDHAAVADFVKGFRAIPLDTTPAKIVESVGKLRDGLKSSVKSLDALFGANV